MKIEDIDVFFFDFDGVLTNNLVIVDQNENEFVTCSRADGLAFDVLRKLKKSVYIVSTEKNSVVSARANKLRVPVLQGVKNKVEALISISKREGFISDKILFVGNDLNDYYAMQYCGFSACPSNSHEKIKEISDIVLESHGGTGVVRELLEDVLNLDFIEILYDEQKEM
ncbi:HAD hydrolase family protein [bacterium]|jgi:YrbI family 3-deoxy-D-manno-octulosonate 8-phosphate phosphatase|nr:HAD hydrolase family protein [bacterium]